MKWFIFSILVCWGTVAVFFLAGDSDEMPLLDFVLIKLVALANIVALYYIWKKMHKLGMLPNLKCNEGNFNE